MLKTIRERFEIYILNRALDCERSAALISRKSDEYGIDLKRLFHIFFTTKKFLSTVNIISPQSKV